VVVGRFAIKLVRGDAKTVNMNLGESFAKTILQTMGLLGQHSFKKCSRYYVKL